MAEDVTAVPYIGEKTARELRKGLSRNNRGKTLTPRRAANLNTNFLQTKLGKRQRKELAKYVGDPETRLLTRQEKSEMAAQQQSGPSETGDTITRGDFRVDRQLYSEGREMHNERSARAQDVDEQRRARVTTDFSKWANNMDEFDYPGIDTPSKTKPRRQDKDRGFVDNNSLLRPFEDEPDGGDSISEGSNQGPTGTLGVAGVADATPAGVKRREAERQAAKSDKDTPGLRGLDSRIRAARGDELDRSDAKYGSDDIAALNDLFK
jgi:hypothetical protein